MCFHICLLARLVVAKCVCAEVFVVVLMQPIVVLFDSDETEGSGGGGGGGGGLVWPSCCLLSEVTNKCG